MIATIIQVPYMTFFAIVGRVVDIAMSVTTIALVGRMTAMVAGERAGLAAAAACTLGASFTYYGQVTNLDAPYLFWSALAMWSWMRLVTAREPRRIGPAMLAIAAAIATKDQAYALFLPGLPLFLAIWFIVDPWARRHVGILLPRLILWAAIALVALLAIDGALTNPSGFSRRLAFLTGSASRDYVQYRADLTGRLALLADMVRSFPHAYPAAAAPLVLLGIALHCSRRRAQVPQLVAGLLPLLAVLSFTVAFNLVALRSENRFLLPHSVFLACYLGIAVDGLAFATSAWLRAPARLLLAALAVIAFVRCAAVDAAFLGDSRYDAERWLTTATRPGDSIEAYGVNAFLPRFPVTARVTRLDRKPLKLRNPLPGVVEISAPYAAVTERNPRFLVISGFWVEGYLRQRLPDGRDGRILQPVQQAILLETENRNYFTGLFAGRLPYRVAHISRYQGTIGPELAGNESLGQTIYIFERHDVPSSGNPAAARPPRQPQ